MQVSIGTKYYLSTGAIVGYNTHMDIWMLQWKSRIITTLLWLPARIGSRVSGCMVKRNITYGRDRHQVLDMYVPQQPTERPAPVVIVIHGGGWLGGDKTEQAYFCTKLAKNGYVVCAINYRLAPRHQFPAALADCELAAAWVSAHITSYGGDPSRTFLAGSSAGAHLAALAAGRGAIAGIKGLVLY
ncbi:MAG: alpha/beta hydrolase, partial [Candidatus Micrarchaeaceae archaeon]